MVKRILCLIIFIAKLTNSAIFDSSENKNKLILQPYFSLIQYITINEFVFL